MRLRLAEIGEGDETLARTLEDLSAFAGYAFPLIDELDSLPASADWGDWLDRLGALATRSLRQPDRVLAVLAELAPMAPVGPVTLTEILIVLEGLLLETAVPPSPQRYGKVFIGPIEAARGLSFDAVLVPGLAEKMFPRKIVEEPILLDAVRERIGEVCLRTRTGSKLSVLPWVLRPARPSDGSVSPIRVSILTRFGHACRPSTHLKP